MKHFKEASLGQSAIEKLADLLTKLGKMNFNIFVFALY